LLISSAKEICHRANKEVKNVELKFSIGEATSNLLEIANVLDSFGGVLKWTFFIALAVLLINIVLYIKKKNATGQKHS